MVSEMIAILFSVRFARVGVLSGARATSGPHTHARARAMSAGYTEYK